MRNSRRCFRGKHRKGYMRKILLVATVQSHIAQFHSPLITLLKESEWEIHVAARDNLAEKNGLAIKNVDKIYNMPFQRNPLDVRNIAAYRMLRRLLAAEPYDIVSCNTPVAGVCARLAAKDVRKQGTKVFYTAHGFHFYKGAPRINWFIYYPIEKFMSRFTDKLITITEEDYALAKKKFHCPVCHIHGVGANSTKYYPISKAEQEVQKKAHGLGGHIIVNVGELLPNKNQKTAIRVMKRIVDRLPDTTLLIAGNGPERENLEKLVKELGLNDHVRFLGYTTRLQEYLQICDVEICCSYREGLPLNVMEAMLCGKPVVASNNRGHRELIHDGVNGYLVEPDDIEGYAKKICKLLRDAEMSGDEILQSIAPFKDVRVQEELKQIYLKNPETKK